MVTGRKFVPAKPAGPLTHFLMNSHAFIKTHEHGGLSAHLIAHINVKLALIGCAPVAVRSAGDFDDIVAAIAAQSREKDRLLGSHLCPADARLQTFLYDYLQDVPVPKLPARTFTLDRAGLARVLSLPVDREDFASDIINSEKRPAHHRRHFSHCGRRLADSR